MGFHHSYLILQQIDEVAYVDKGRNLAVALGERDVKVRKFRGLAYILMALDNLHNVLLQLLFFIILNEKIFAGRRESKEQERKKGLLPHTSTSF